MGHDADASWPGLLLAWLFLLPAACSPSPSDSADTCDAAQIGRSASAATKQEERQS
jgi:hypothetical protein